MKTLLFFLLFLLSSNLYAAAEDDTFSTPANTNLTANVLDNDSGLNKKVKSYSSPSHGTLVSTNENGNFEYKPGPDYTGTDSFTYAMQYQIGPFLHTDTATVTITITSATSAIDNDLCYDSISVSGLNFGIASFLSKTTIPIRNISDDDLSNVEVVLASDALFSAFQECSILDGDGSETCSQTSDLSFFNTFTVFNSGITYNLQTLTPNDSKSMYVESLFSFLDTSDYDLLATYTKNGTTYTGKLSQCQSNAQESSNGRPFTIRNPIETRNIRGNVKIIGNTVLCKKDSNNQCVETSSPNNDTTLSYIKEVDGFTNSSQAKISDIPDNAEIVWAGFYAQGYTNESLETVRADLNSEPMYLIAPDNTLFPLYPEVIDSLQWNGYTYSTFSTVNALIGKKGSEVNGWWTGANIKAREGKDTSLGYFGAWTLVLIYQDSSESFRNITVFDGYTNISKYNQDETIELEGFLTPKSGDINSTFSFFAGEGDLAYTGDRLYFNDTEIGNTGNVMYSHTSGFEKNPNKTNNFGIDIQNIDIGTSGANLLGYKDTSATVRFTSTADSYYPSMFVFTTNLYTLDICYDYTYGQNGFYTTAPSIKPALIDGTFNKSTPLDLKLYFRNRENSDTTISNLYIDLLNITDATYHLNSTKTSKVNTNGIIDIDDDDLDIASNKSYVKDIPIGNFGSLEYFYLYYGLDLNKSTLTGTPIDIEFHYDLNVDGIGLGTYTTKLSEMNTCQQTPGYKPIPGIFNIVHDYYIKNTEPYYYFNLPTQVVNRYDENFKVESMDPDNLNISKAVSTAQDINISMVNMAGFHYTNATCTDPDNSIVIGNPVTVHFNINDKTISIDNSAMQSAAIFAKASQNTAFRITYTDSNNITKSICSRDNFSIRPEAFLLKIDDQNQSTPTISTPLTTNYSGVSGATAPVLDLAADYNYKLKVIATQHADNTPSQWYNHSFSTDDEAQYKWEPRSITTVNANLYCNDKSDSNITTLGFYNGSAEINTSVQQVGEYRLHLKDKTWTIVDSTIPASNSITAHHVAPYFLTGVNSDCTANSVTQQETSSLLNGCYIDSQHKNPDTNVQYNDFNVTFHPYKFDLSGITLNVGLNSSPATANSFVYMADIDKDKNMSYHLNGIIIPKGRNGATLSNFVDKCYATPLDINLSTPDRTLNDIKGNHVAFKVRFHDLNSSGSIITANDINITESSSAGQTADIHFLTVQNNTKGYFPKNLNGTMSTRLNINYTKAKNTTVNPKSFGFIKYKINDTKTFKADLQANKAAKGFKNFNNPITFYYGRAHAGKQRYVVPDDAPYKANIYYEIYCFGAGCDANTSIKPVNPHLLHVDDIRWYQNTLHNPSRDGNVTNVVEKDGINKVSSKDTAGNDTLNNTTNPATVNLKYNESLGYPYTTTMEVNASGWLIYNENDANATTNSFQVEFNKAGTGWVGKHETNAETNTTGNVKTNRRTMW